MIELAINNRNANMLELLIEYGADVNGTSYFISHLHSAIIEENLSCVEVLIKHGAKVTKKEVNSATDKNKQIIRLVKEAYDQRPIKVISEAQKELNKLLIRAIDLGNILDVEQALIAGADPNAYCNDDTENMLMQTIHYHPIPNSPEIIRLLAQYGADVNDRPAHKGALYRAIFRKDIPAYRTLLELGAQMSGPEWQSLEPNSFDDLSELEMKDQLKAIALEFGWDPDE